MSTRKRTLDLHPIYNRGELIDAALERAMDDAEERKAGQLEIICGKGSGATSLLAQEPDHRLAGQSFFPMVARLDRTFRIF